MSVYFFHVNYRRAAYSAIISLCILHLSYTEGIIRDEDPDPLIFGLPDPDLLIFGPPDPDLLIFGPPDPDLDGLHVTTDLLN